MTNATQDMTWMEVRPGPEEYNEKRNGQESETKRTGKELDWISCRDSEQLSVTMEERVEKNRYPRGETIPSAGKRENWIEEENVNRR